MAKVVVRHKVEDLGKWKSVYESLDSFHKENGVKRASVLRSADNPNELIVISELADMAAARRFAQLPGLKDAMQKAGVSDHPDIYFTEELLSRSFA